MGYDAKALLEKLIDAGISEFEAEKVVADQTNELAEAMLVGMRAQMLGIDLYKATKKTKTIAEPPFIMSTERRIEFFNWLNKLGLTVFMSDIPPLNVTDDEYKKTLFEGKDYFFIHITSLEKYRIFMAAVGQGAHWTITGEDNHKIIWDLSPAGYWIKADAVLNCPSLAVPYNTLANQIKLLSLEEYVIVWHATKVFMNVMLDQSTWCWLRTRYNGSSALRVFGFDHRVFVYPNDAGDLSVPFDFHGGRVAEVVK